MLVCGVRLVDSGRRKILEGFGMVGSRTRFYPFIKKMPFLFLCYRHQFYDETLAVFGTSRDRRLPDATGSSLVPAVMQMMVRAADEREFVDFLVAAAAESFRRSVKATLKDVEPGDIDSFVSHVLGASAAIGSCLACESSDRAIWRGACC